MNKFLIALAAIALSLTSCQNACDVKDDINQLKNERDYVNLQLSNKRTTLQALELKHGNINAKLRAIDSLALYNEQLKLGKTRYVITFEGKQSHFSLDISEHVKDEMNAFTFEIPVDAVYYRSVNIGDNIVDEFRTGSLFMKSSFGDMKLKVIGKRIEN